MKDSYGRTIDYLRISLTDRCNLRCIYCMPEEGVASLGHENILRIEEIAAVVDIAARMGVKHVRLTGGEPLVRKGIVDLVTMINQTPGIESIALTTNATLLPRMAQPLKDAGLSRVNISLDTLDAAQYHFITRRGTLSDALAGIQAALEAGLEPVKLNTVVVRALNQDFLAFAKLTLHHPLHVRFIEYMPVGEDTGCNSCGWSAADVIPAATILTTIDEQACAAGIGPLKPLANNAREIPIGWGPARYYTLPNAQGSIGVISAISNHFCSSCNRLRLTADGKLRPCLFSDMEYDVKTPLRAGDMPTVETIFEEVLRVKPEAHFNKVGTKRMMSQVGG